MGVSEKICMAVNIALPKYCSVFEFQNYSYYYNLHHYFCKTNGTLSSKPSDKTTLCEFNVGLWDKSIISAINCLSLDKHTHQTIVQQFINYLLNAHPYTDFGLLEDYFHRLLLLHPPNVEKLDYYQEILCGSYITMNGHYVEDTGMFTCLLEILFNILNDPDYAQSNDDANIKSQSSQLPGKIDESCMIDEQESLNEKNMMYFEELSWSEKMNRCLTALNFAYNILETDLAFWINRGMKNLENNNRPLMCYLLWPDKRGSGLCNQLVNRILKIFILGNKLETSNFPHFDVIKKFVNLLSETIRVCDKEEEIMYPHVGKKCHDLARELSGQLFELMQSSYEGNSFTKMIEVLRSLKPPWLRLLLCSHLISYITGYQCLPELTAVLDILTHITSSAHRSDFDKKEFYESSKSSVDWKRVQRLRARSSVNIKYKGKTRLQAACESNDVEEVKALLVFPELDLNGTDTNGWTALHLACRKGNETCVRQLLTGLPSHHEKSINTRAKGPENFTPLMCAVVGGYPEICHLLLQHTGAVLLNDLNDYNQSPLDLSESKEITRILDYYKRKISATDVKPLRNISFDEKYKELIGKLCVELVLNYFITYRTWDVCKVIKNIEGYKSPPENPAENSYGDSQWDHRRYHRDIMSSLGKLKELASKLVDLKEFESSMDMFNRVLSLVNFPLAT